MKHRILFLTLASFVFHSLSAVTVKVEDWYIDDDNQVHVNSQTIYTIANSIKNSLFPNDPYEENYNIDENSLIDNDIAVLVDKDGNMVFLSKKSYDVVVNNIDNMVPGSADFAYDSIRYCSNLSLADLENTINQSLNHIEWQKGLGELVTAQLTPLEGNNPGDVAMDVDDFVVLFMNQYN